MLCLLIITLLFGAVCSAQLYQINQVNVFCTNEAQFACSHSNGHKVEWTVSLPNGINRTLPFNTLTDPVSVEKFTVLQSTTMRGSLIFVNSSYLVTTLTLAAHINATVRCQSQSIDYQFQDYSKFLPAELTLTPLDDMYGLPQYQVTWKPDDWANVSRYLVAVSPATPPCGVHQFVSFTSATINLDKDVNYDISVSFGTCPDRMKSSFNFGQCELLLQSSYVSVVNYTIDIFGNITATITCTQQNVSTISEVHCDPSGQWIPDINEYCNPPTTLAEEITPEFTTRGSTIQENTTIASREDKSVNVFIYVIIGSVTGSSILMLCIGFILGLLLGFKCSNKTQTEVSHIQHFQEEEIPKLHIYEEFNIQDRNDIGFSENVAYGETKM